MIVRQNWLQFLKWIFRKFEPKPLTSDHDGYISPEMSQRHCRRTFDEPLDQKMNQGNLWKNQLRRSAGLLPQLIGLKILKYTKYSCDFQTSI